MQLYDPAAIEPQWQAFWATQSLAKASNTKKPTCYVLDMFPYPSGQSMHVGHPRGYVATDVYARMKRSQGYNVLHPMGWDAFGLPAEETAIQNQEHPAITVKRNIATFKQQLQMMGMAYDWSREINTTDPHYYRQTQRIFLEFFRRGLAYNAEVNVNWCPALGTVLANEDIVDGKSERGGHPVYQMPLRQWVLAITQYADRLLEDLSALPQWPEKIKNAQRQWIGRSVGYRFSFSTSAGVAVPVYTTRLDTLMGCSFVVLAPDSPLVEEILLTGQVSNPGAIAAYQATAQQKTERDRIAEKDKTGVILEGATATHPATGEALPIVVADYVLGHYGSGAIMAVPAHDDRDYAMAALLQLPIVPVIQPQYSTWTVIEQSILPQYREQFPPYCNQKIQQQTDWGAFWKVTLPTTEEEDFLVWLHNAMDPIGPEGNPTGWYTDSIGSSNRVYFSATSTVLSVLSSAEIAIFKNTGRSLGIKEEQLDIIPLPYTEKTGVLVNSGPYTGMDIPQATTAMAADIGAVQETQYKMRDWIFSRQRFWGEPFPIVWVAGDAAYAALQQSPIAEWMPENPITSTEGGITHYAVPVAPQYLSSMQLPDVPSYTHTEGTDGPLAGIPEWVHGHICLETGEVSSTPGSSGTWVPCMRETNTMPQWAGSSWYWLRFMDADNAHDPFSKESAQHWGPVDVYAGADHAVAHLLYARFWHKVLYDAGMVDFIEPFTRLEFLGYILANDGTKISKRKGNSRSPEDVVRESGADSFRLYEMAIGPFEKAIPWSDDGLTGCRRFLEKVWKYAHHSPWAEESSPQALHALHTCIEKVTGDIETFKFNTAVSALMICLTSLQNGHTSKRDFALFLQLLSPFAPHIAEELWQQLGHSQSIFLSPWPVADPTHLTASTTTYAVQINGKVRTELPLPTSADRSAVLSAAMADPTVQKWLGSQPVVKEIFVPGRLIGLVTAGLPKGEGSL